MDHTPTSPQTGLDCPNCGFRIPTSIHMLLHSLHIFCNQCGLKLSMDRQASEEALEALETLQQGIAAAQQYKSQQ